MKNIVYLLALIVAFCLWGCSSTSANHTSSVTVTVSCNDPGMKFTGTIVSDGQSQPVAGKGSRTFQITGETVTFSFKKTGADGQISLAVMKGDECIGRSTTDAKFGGVRGEIQLRSGVVQKANVETFR
ncbi:MAG TPA: hypothetical protein VGO57_10775 [Verrucomicrobiae bacterium]|jgi:hypothetical protein